MEAGIWETQHSYVRTFFIRVHRACGFVEHRERRFPEIVKTNVSLVWAISLRNVVIGKYGPEKHPRQTHALLFAPAQHIRPVVFRHVKAEGLRLHEFREVHGAQRLIVKKKKCQSCMGNQLTECVNGKYLLA